MTVSVSVSVKMEGDICHISIQRPEQRNAVDGPTARALAQAFRMFDKNSEAKVAILSGTGGHFCAGADLHAFASGDPDKHNPLSERGDGPMGPTRMQLSKPVIAAVDGYCVAGGLELALWCDLRVASEHAVFGVFCRRFGVPLIDGGSIRLPRLIGQSRAMDMILTGRPVDAQEALSFGLANRVVPHEQLEEQALSLARQIASFPQQCLRNDRESALTQWSMSEADAIHAEFALGLETLSSGESRNGATAFAQGRGRHGDFQNSEP